MERSHAQDCRKLENLVCDYLKDIQTLFQVSLVVLTACKNIWPESKKMRPRGLLNDGIKESHYSLLLLSGLNIFSFEIMLYNIYFYVMGTPSSISKIFKNDNLFNKAT